MRRAKFLWLILVSIYKVKKPIYSLQILYLIIYKRRLVNKNVPSNNYITIFHLLCPFTFVFITSLGIIRIPSWITRTFYFWTEKLFQYFNCFELGMNIIILSSVCYNFSLFKDFTLFGHFQLHLNFVRFGNNVFDIYLNKDTLQLFWTKNFKFFKQ